MTVGELITALQAFHPSYDVYIDWRGEPDKQYTIEADPRPRYSHPADDSPPVVLL